MVFEDFCATELWIRNQTWDTSEPDFTPCFVKTALSWFPPLVLLIVAVIEVPFMHLQSDARNIRPNWINMSKMALTVAASACAGAEFVMTAVSDSDPPTVDYVTTMVFFLSYVASALLLWSSMHFGIRTQPAQFFFYFVHIFTGGVTLRSIYRRKNQPELYAEFEDIDADKIDNAAILYTIQYACVLALFFLNLIADRKPSHYNPIYDTLEKPSPEISAPFVSIVLFEWMTPLLWWGFRRPLKQDDMWDLDPHMQSYGIVPTFENEIQNQLKKAERNRKKGEEKPKISLLPVMSKCFWWNYFLGSVYKVAADVLALASPQVMGLIIDYTTAFAYDEIEDEPEWHGYFYAATMLICVMGTSILNAAAYAQMYMLSNNIRTAVTSAVFTKSLRLSSTSKRASSVGEIVNLMAVDIQRFMDLMPFLNMIWSAPIQISFATYFIYKELDVAAFAGFAIIILAVPLNAVAAGISRRYQYVQMENKDQRVKLMNEILGGIKVLKLYGWEESFMQQVLDIRSREIAVLKKSAWLNSIITFIWNNVPILFTLASFTVYIFMDDDNLLTADKAYVSISYINILKLPMVIIPYLVIALVQSKVSLDRINVFMNNVELDKTAVIKGDVDESEDAVKVEKGTFKWDISEPQSTLHDISLEVKRNSLTAVVGSVGAGKSSLIAALLGDMEKESGTVKVNGKVAYVPQQAWMVNATVENNILFSKKSNKAKYESVIDACALRSDLDILPGGDQTEIGEKGINLSGGQKQRISLARAVYNDRDVYLLDDPLSAVDSHVGKHIFENVIGETGMLKDKTRILVTHAVTYLPKTDHIIVLKHGRISEQGSYAELLAKKGDFAKFLLEHIIEEEEEEGIDSEEEEELKEMKQELAMTMGKGEFEKQVSVIQDRQISVRSHSYEEGDDKFLHHDHHGHENQEEVAKQNEILKHMISRQDTESTVEQEEELAKGARLIEEESAEAGGVKSDVYLYYMRSIGWFGTLFSLLMYAVSTGGNIGSSLWLSVWTENGRGNSSEVHWRNVYLGVYGALGAVQAFALMFVSISIYLTTLTASKRLHKNMLDNVLRAPMSFFDTTPLGRIVNRFAKDVDICDYTLPTSVNNFLNFGFQFLGAVVLILTVIPIFVVVIVPVTIVFLVVQKIFVDTARQLKRLESISRSPVYSHFAETVAGQTTIRAFDMEENFIKESQHRVDSNQVSYYLNQMINRWLSIRLETLGNLITFGACLYIILDPDAVNPSEVGLVINYALTITSVLNYVVRFLTEVETNIVAVERIREYTNDIDQEAEWVLEDKTPDPKWPQEGHVEFDDYGIRYRPGLDLVLKNISVDISGGEMVGIVGRTGAGKSTLTVALFRLVEAAEGKIVIDGEDISALGLHDLRKKLTIIPQDPVLFSGTLRINLDPFAAYTDEQVWKALELSHLKEFATSLEHGLQHEISEGGENLSVGQRQLLCLGRALLRKTKVLILDEATAAVDLETDDLIQATIRKEFKGCTVLTIAHRLNTIMDYDKIMVLDKGQIKEFDSPQNLLEDQDTIFYSMAKNANLA